MSTERTYNPLPPDVGMLAVLQDDRLVLESIRTKFDALGVEQTAGTLILETKIPATTMQTLKFEVMKDVGTQFDTEIRLDRPDAFTITKAGLFLGVRLVAGAAANQGCDRLFSGPDTLFEALGITSDLIWAFQRGKLKLQSDTVVYVETFDVGLQSRRSNVAQRGLDPGAGDLYLDNAWGRDNGMSPMVPSITLSGAMKNVVEYTMPRPIVTSGISNTLEVHAVLVLRGFLSQGGAEFRTAKPNS